MTSSNDSRYCPSCGAHSDTLGCPECGTATLERATLKAVADDLRAGDIVAERYRVTELLGRGAFGAVFGAEHVATRQRIALKMLVSNPASSPEEDIRRFFREA